MKKGMINKLYKFLNRDIARLDYDLRNDYLTELKGKDGNSYLWFWDNGNKEAFINQKTGLIITDTNFLMKIS